MSRWPYNSREWRALRRAKLAATPACEPCAAMGRRTRADTVDHRLAVSQGGPAFPPLSGLTSMCAHCHSAKTARSGEAGAVRTRKPRRGCRPDGTPVDPMHPWNSPPEKSLGAGAADRLGSRTRTKFPER